MKPKTEELRSWHDSWVPLAELTAQVPLTLGARGLALPF